MNFLLRYVKQRVKVILAFALFALIFAVTFILYGFPIEAVAYPAIICALVAFLIGIADFISQYRKHKRLTEMKKLSASTMTGFPRIDKITEKDYQEIVEALCEEEADLVTEMSAKMSDMSDYYTVWVHQIKTPIASMRLMLQNEDSSHSRRLSSELFRIEQYVQMVMAFVRLDSQTSDYVFREHELDKIIRQSVKKFAGEFIGRKIRLDYEPINIKVITDEKWLCFVIEQLLSNALKYTSEGYVKIYLSEPDTLCIEDSGIGIAPEDLPRVFDKGYTGYNGRSDKKASGIGLYICKSICDKLCHSISIESVPDKGTAVSLFFGHSMDRIE